MTRAHASERDRAPRISDPAGLSARWSLAPKLLSLVAVALVLQGCASFRNPQAILAELGPREALPLAWQISGGGGANLYVLGSIHLGPAGGWHYPTGIMDALKDSSALVVEVNVQEIDSGTIQHLIDHYGHMPPGHSLKRHVSPATWELLEHRLAHSSIPLRTANRLRPWLLSNLLIMEAIRRQHYSPDQGTEEEFIRLAGSRSVLPLESAAEQISFLGSLPRRVQELYLIDTLEHYDEAGDFVDLYVNAWRAGDEKALDRLIFESYRKDPSFKPFFDSIIFERNRRMGRQLKVLLEAKQHAGESVFVVLGVAHMVGDQSIGRRFAADGYQVHRVTRAELRSPLVAGESIAVHP